uniref:THAP-type domain-containing protein n=1 Tax=Eptatretus burgeri TaxID=7764 RepID=A0A8C4QJV2_EPTBU
MTGCCAFGCSNRSEKGFHMYRFPRNPERRKLWVKRVRRVGWELTSSFVSVPDSFTIDLSPLRCAMHRDFSTEDHRSNLPRTRSGCDGGNVVLREVLQQTADPGTVHLRDKESEPGT